MTSRIFSTPYVFNVDAINAIVERKFDNNVIHPEESGIKRENDNFFYQGEMHDFWEIVYVEQGKVTVSENEKVYELSEGQAIFHPPMEFHRFVVNTENFPVVLKIFSFNLTTNIEHNLAKGIFTLNLNQCDYINEIFKAIKENYYSAWWANDKKEEVEIMAAEELRVVKMIENFLLDMIIENDPDRTQNSSIGAKRYKEIIKTLKEHLNEDLTIDQVSKLCHLSVSYIKKLFSLYAGCGVMQYFIKLKISQSIKYLGEGKSVGEVADLLAFSSPSYFSVVFKKETGHSPIEYKLGN